MRLSSVRSAIDRISGNHRTALWILGALLVFRLAVVLVVLQVAPSNVIHGDTERLLEPGIALVEKGQLLETVQGQTLPATSRPPLFPLMAAVSYWVFGAFTALAVVQVLISVATAGLVYATAHAMAGTRAGIAALAVYALDPIVFYYSQVLLSQTTFVFFLALALYLGVRAFQATTFRLWQSLGCGGALAMAIFTREQGYYLGYLVPLGTLVAGTLLTRWPWRRTVATALLIFVPCAVVVGGWQFRNYSATGAAVFAAGAGGSNLFIRKGLPILMVSKYGLQRTMSDWKELLPQLREEVESQIPGLDQMTPEQWSAAVRKVTFRAAASHPGATLQLATVGFLKTYFIPGEVRPLGYLGLAEIEVGAPGFVGDVMRLNWTDFWNTYPGDKPLAFFLGVGYLLFLIVVYLAAVVGFARLSTRGRSHLLISLLCLGAFLYLTVQAGLDGSERYRIATFFIVAVFSGVGFGALFRERYLPARHVN